MTSAIGQFSIGNDAIGSAPAFDYTQTVISQFANSPVMLALIQNMAASIAADGDIDNFYSTIWDINTAQGFGLDIWGRILGISRNVNIPAIFPVLVAPGVTPLPDNQYRTLLLVKAMTNISNCSAPQINNALQALFPNKGKVYVVDQGNMHILYMILFAPDAWQYAILGAPGALPRPAGVGVTYQTENPWFGFAEATSWETFGHGVFAQY